MIVMLLPINMVKKSKFYETMDRYKCLFVIITIYKGHL